MLLTTNKTSLGSLLESYSKDKFAPVFDIEIINNPEAEEELGYDPLKYFFNNEIDNLKWIQSEFGINKINEPNTELHGLTGDKLLEAIYSKLCFYVVRSFNDIIGYIITNNRCNIRHKRLYFNANGHRCSLANLYEIAIMKEAKLYIAAKERADLMSHKAMETAEIENNELHCIQWEVEISNITNYKVADIPDFLNYLINIEMIHSWKLFTDKSYVMVYIDNNRTVKKYNLIFTSHQLENINSRFYCSKMRTDVGNEIDCIFKWLKISLQEFIEFRK